MIKTPYRMMKTVSSKSSLSGSQQSLAELAQVVASSAVTVEDELRKKEIPPPDDESFPVSFPLLSSKGCRARFELLSAALNIVQLASGPAGSLTNLTMRVTRLVPCLYGY